SVTPAVDFDAALRDRLGDTLAAAGIRAPVLPTGAGHDAGILAAQIPAGMLFVRNPTRGSRSPAAHAETRDGATRGAARGRGAAWRGGGGGGAGRPGWRGCPGGGCTPGC